MLSLKFSSRGICLIFLIDYQTALVLLHAFLVIPLKKDLKWFFLITKEYPTNGTLNIEHSKGWTPRKEINMPEEYEEETTKENPEEENASDTENTDTSQDTSTKAADSSLQKQEEEPTFELDGEKLTASQIKELKEKATYEERYKELQSRETRTSQELADIKRQMEEKENYNNLPEDQRQIQDYLNNLIDQRVEQRVSPLTVKQLEAEAKDELELLQDKYAWATFEQIERAAQHADEINRINGNHNIHITTAFRDLFFDEVAKNSKKEGSDKTLKNLNKRKAAITQTSKSNNLNANKGEVDVSNMSWKDVIALDKQRESGN